MLDLALTKAEMAHGSGTCMAKAASSGKRRLSATTYDVEIIFSSAVVSDGALTKAADALKANGVEGVASKTSMDPMLELKVIPGTSTRASFKRLTLRPRLLRRRLRRCLRNLPRPLRPRAHRRRIWYRTTAAAHLLP